MNGFWDFLFSPLGLAVYAAYRALKLFVWMVILPRVLPYLPTSLRSRIETVQARAKALLPRLTFPRPLKDCCQ